MANTYVQYTGQIFTFRIKAVNNSPVENTNIIVTLVQTSAGIGPGVSFAYSYAQQGVYDHDTLTWSVGTLPGNSVRELILKLKVDDITKAPFTTVATVTGTNPDGNPLNNVKTYIAEFSTLPPVGGAIEDYGGLVIDVSKNDTLPTQGTPEWRLNLASVTNSVSYEWDPLTGIGIFTPVDPTVPVTGTYVLWTVVGVNEYALSGATAFTLLPTLENKNVFDHKLFGIEGSTLTLDEIAILNIQYPTLNTLDIQGYCWNIIRNANGVLTSGIPYKCNVKQDTRTHHFVSAVDINIVSTALPVDVVAYLAGLAEYVSQEGDAVHVKHPNGESIFGFNGTVWARTWYKHTISKQVGNVLSLGPDNAPYYPGGVVETYFDQLELFPTTIGIAYNDVLTVDIPAVANTIANKFLVLVSYSHSETPANHQGVLSIDANSIVLSSSSDNVFFSTIINGTGALMELKLSVNQRPASYNVNYPTLTVLKIA